MFAIDGGISKQPYANFHHLLAKYAQAGGTVILGCLFSRFCRPPDTAALFQNFDLQWKTGNYERDTFSLNPAAHGVFGEDVYATLAPSYSMKALHLKGAVPASAKIYTAEDEAPTAVDSQQSPTVFARYGRGFVGYVGDVNQEEGSNALVMAILGQ